MDDLAFDRRRFVRAGAALGAGVLAARAAGAQDTAPAAAMRPSTSTAAATPAPAQASGPIVLHGASPRLTVHALDTWHGAAAAGLRIDFSRQDGDGWRLVRSVTANANGRSDEPLLVDDSYRAGSYELLLHVDEYFARKRASLPGPSFLTKVPVRIRIVDTSQRIHLPIQFGPWSYTYSRGS